MEIVLATHGFAGMGGSETYVLTVAEQLQRLGHAVTIHALEGGAMSEFATDRGLHVAVGERGLPAGCDVILVQDSALAYELADRWPSTPQVFRACSYVYDFQFPAQLPGTVAAVVVLNDRMARHVAALDQEHDVVRLRQPVDTNRFRPLVEIGDTPRCAVLLSNYLSGRRARLLADVWGEAGVECVTIGLDGSPSTSPEDAIASADIVVGKARAIVEAMACGRAAYVLDLSGGDGWVTPELYPALEADNFAGEATEWALSRERLAADLDEYRAEMGLANRDLALAYHSADQHAYSLVELFRRVSPRAEPVAGPLRELARLVRLQWQRERDALSLRGAVAELTKHAQVLEARATELEAERDSLLVRDAEFAAGFAELDRYVRTVEADAADLRAQLATRRVRAGLALGRLLDHLRPRGARR